MKVAVVIPNWNGADMLAACLHSLEQQSVPATIIVVDNGSEDESVSIIEQQFPKVILLKNKTNLGFAGGVNTGIRHALTQGFEAVALFNNDAVAHKHWLAELIKTLETGPKIGIATGKFLRMGSDRLDTTGELYSIYGSPSPRGRNQTDNGQFDDRIRVFGATGGASLYRAEMLEAIGLFDERFFAYYEDIDISFRARLAGWEIIFNPAARAEHHIGATSSRLGSFTRFHVVKNFHLLYFKNMPGLLFWYYLPAFGIGSGLLFVSSLRKGRGLTHLRGVLTALWLLPSSLTERHRTQAARTVSLRAIRRLLSKKLPSRIPKLPAEPARES